MTQTTPHERGREVVDLAREPSFAIGAMTVKPSACEVEIAGETHKLEPRELGELGGQDRHSRSAS